MAWSFTEDWGEYFALLFWATVGMMLLTAAEELLTLFLTLETMTICLYLVHGVREDQAAVGGGGPEVLRLRLGLLGAVPVRPEPALRPDRDARSFDAIRQALHPVGGGDVTGLAGNVAGATAVLLMLVGLRVQGRGGAVPPVGPRRLRRGAGAGDGLDRDRLEDRQLRGADEGACSTPCSRGRARRRRRWQPGLDRRRRGASRPRR